MLYHRAFQILQDPITGYLIPEKYVYKKTKKVYSVGSLTTTIDYCGETEFYNNALKYLHTEEGVVEYQITSFFTYDYFLKDDLGNTRAVVSADSSGNLVIG